MKVSVPPKKSNFHWINFSELKSVILIVSDFGLVLCYFLALLFSVHFQLCYYSKVKLPKTD